ncbi:MAG: hypothetical protein DRN05_00005, partial [Thermoplasmata archaeon]
MKQNKTKNKKTTIITLTITLILITTTLTTTPTTTTATPPTQTKKQKTTTTTQQTPDTTYPKKKLDPPKTTNTNTTNPTKTYLEKKPTQKETTHNNTQQKNTTKNTITYNPKTQQIQITIHPPKPQLQETKQKNKTYTTIKIPGSHPTGKPGTPNLPAIPYPILLPPKTTTTKITTKTQTITINTTQQGINLKEKPIQPIPPPTPTNQTPTQTINQQTYNLNKPILNKTIENQGIQYSHGYTILLLHILPIDYNPKKAQLLYHKKIQINIQLQTTNKTNPYLRPNKTNDKKWVETLVKNPEMTKYYQNQKKSTYPGGLCNPNDNNGKGYNYIILVRETLYNLTNTNHTWEDLINKKEQQGLTATKIKIEDILACPDYWNPDPLFNDTPAKIREFCRDAYTDWETEYILIAGDNDDYNPESKIERRKMTSSFSGSLETDIYWTHLDGTFNGDHDNEWGEDNDFDYFSEMYSGSIPCDEPADISNWLTKSFYYADNTDSDYLENTGFYAGQSLSHDIIDQCAVEKFEQWNNNHPERAFNLSVKWTAGETGDGWQGGTLNEAITGLRNAINSDNCTIISGIAHANPWKSLDVYDWEENYHNTKPFLLLDMGCKCGDMDGADDGVLHSMLFHSDTELAFACIYNTGLGNYIDDPILQGYFWEYMFNVTSGRLPLWKLGMAQEWARDKTAALISPYNHLMNTIESSHLFGDPAQTLKPPGIPEHNIGITEIQTLNHTKNNETINITTIIINDGLNDETNIIIKLYIDDIEVNSTTIPLIKSYSTIKTGFLWTTETGSHTIKINASIPNIAEQYYYDNEKNKSIIVGVLNNNTQQLFDTITDAIENPNTQDGHTLITPPGLYQENIVIRKNISLLGINKNTTILKPTSPNSPTIYFHDVASANISGFTIQNTNSATTYVENSSNVTITDCIISSVDSTADIPGIHVASSTNTSIINNEIYNTSIGVFTTEGTHNTTIKNNLIHNIVAYQAEGNGAIVLDSTAYSHISSNNLINNCLGILIRPQSINNTIYHNNFINNTINAHDYGQDNQWDNGYPTGGNYWDDHTGPDNYHGPNQNIPGSDSIIDTPRNIPNNTQDNYPLLKP